MEQTIYKPGVYKSTRIYKGAGGIYKGRGVYNDGAGGVIPPIPDEYELIEYIDIVQGGSRGIEIKFDSQKLLENNKNNIKVELNVEMLKSNVGSTRCYIFYLRNSGSSVALFRMRPSDKNLQGSNDNSGSVSTTIANLNYDVNKIILNKNKITINENEYSLSYSENTIDTLLVGTYGAGTTAYQMKLYELKIFSTNEENIFNAVPVKRILDSVNGMYDFISGNFYINH